MDEITEHSLKSSCLSRLTNSKNFSSVDSYSNKNGRNISDILNELDLSSDNNSEDLDHITLKKNYLSNSLSSSKTGSSFSSVSSFNIVRDTVQDVMSMQNEALKHVHDAIKKQKMGYVDKAKHENVIRELEQEKLNHEKCQILLEKETHRRKFIESEVESLKVKQKKENEHINDELRNAKQKVARETQRSDFLQSKLYEMEIELQKKEALIEQKNLEIDRVRLQLQTARKKHKKEVEEKELDALQSRYMSKSLANSGTRRKYDL